MTRIEKTLRKLQERLSNRLGVWLDLDDVRSLRRQAMRLHRWYEAECNGEIERFEDTDKPFRVIRRYNGHNLSYPTPDHEKAAEKKIKAICERLSLHYYLQTDPRGGTLYISREPLTQQNYTQGAFVW